MKLPDKVRVGETLSARWLNQVVDCLKELAKASNVGSGSSTSSIEYSGSDYRDTKYRGTGGTDLQEFRVVPFQLRLKPKHLCGVSADGNWPKIAQMKAGAILDYMGKTHPVPKGATIYDYTEGWVDLGTFSEGLTKIYCTIKQNYKGEILSAEIKKSEDKFVPWGKTESNLKGDGVLSVFIGSYQLRKIEEVNRAHIYQAHCGTLDLQTIQVEKLFDADEEAKEEAESGSNVESDNYYTAPESEEYESKPAGLFRKRDEHLFIFKKLICGEGLRLTDGKNLRIKLRRANSVWPDGSGTLESLEEDEPVITLGGVEDIVFDKEISAPELDSGIIRIPLADTLEEITGAICGLEVSYAPAMLEDDGTVTFLGEDGSRLPQGAAQAEGGSGSGSGDGPYINEIVEGVIYITIPIFVDAPSASASLSMSASESESASVSESDSASLSASQSESETESFSDSASDSASKSLSASASASDSASGSASDSASESSSASVSASLEDSASDSVGGSGSTGGGSTGGSTQPGSAWEPDDESESDSASGSASGSGSASAADSASGSIVDSGSEQSSSESSTPPGSSPSEGGSTAGSSPEESKPPGGSVPGESLPGGSTPGGSVPGGSIPGSEGSGCCGCDCATKLAEMAAQITALEQRIAELEKKECNCQCGDLLAQIQAAIAAEAQAIANSISYSVSVNGTAIATTEYGTLVADTTGSISGSGATVHSNIHY